MKCPIQPLQNIKETEVEKWLRNTVKLPQYISIFKKFETLDMLKEIKKNDLKELGVKLLAHKLLILHEIAKFKNVK